VLSIGCGWGETEAELGRKGIEVTVIPLDSVIAACAESRGVKIVYDGFEGAMAQLQGRRFDAVLMSGILHLQQDPIKALCNATSLLTEHGVLVATIPTFRRLPFLWLRLRHPSRYTGWRDFQRSGVHPVSRRKARDWFRDAGLSVERISTTIPERWKTLVASSGGLAGALFSSEYTFVGRRVELAGEAILTTILTRQSEVEPEMTGVMDGNPGR
jgi:SAM-dependent methyltransferase